MNDPPRGVGVDYKVLRQAGKRRTVAWRDPLAPGAPLAFVFWFISAAAGLPCARWRSVKLITT
jgi:hypothetical protein